MPSRRVLISLCLLALLLACVLVRRPNDSDAGYFPLDPEQAPNYDKLVSARWVSELINGQVPPTYPGNGYVVLHVGASDDRKYSRGHIPGAVLVLTNQIERAPMWNLISNGELQEVIEGLGITRHSTVVVYGSDDTAAARILWTLLFAGVDDVRLLDGGIRSWKRFGGRTESGHHSPAPSSFGGEVPLHPEYLASLEDVKLEISDTTSVLVDVRSKSEFDGKTSGYDYVKAKGRIPSSIWGGEAKELVSDIVKMKRRWADLGVSQERPTIFYCGTGWRSSLAFFHAHLFGFKDLRNFDGSWLEWSSTEPPG
jgi:3-mercaptopyruvate sulfurtransferase SseA